MRDNDWTLFLQQLKVSNFRRYYRSVRYYAVQQLSDEALKTREARKAYIFWWFIYKIDESIFMRSPPIICDDEKHEEHVAPGEQVKKYLIRFIDQCFSNL